MDYAQLSKYHIQSVSDQPNYRCNAYMSAGAPTAVLPEQAAIWSYPMTEDNDDAVIFNMINSMLQRIHLSGSVTELTDEKFRLIKDAVSVYKNIRSDIASAVPYYPMGLPEHGDDWLCLAMKTAGCTRVIVWRMKSDKESITIPFDFPVKSVERLYPSKDDYVTEKTSDGIKITLPDQFCAVLFEIK